ncbi:MAG: ABC transporter ATP-binding protein [Thermoplasmata archaeon]
MPDLRVLVPPRVFAVDSLSKRFGTQDALVGVTASLAPGTIGLVGPNGAGKSTLLRLLMGLLVPTSGTIEVLGLDSQAAPLEVRQRVGYMPEHDCLIPSMSGVGFVAYMGTVSGLAPEFAMGRAHDVLQFVGIHEERYRRIEEYSVGMRQRVKLAQAIVHDPPLCFLDEPTSGLDPKGRGEMLELLRALKDLGGHSLVLSTHLLPDVEGLCDQILMLDAGQLLAAGPLAPLLASHEDETVVRVKGAPDRFLASLTSRGWSPRAVGSEIRVALGSGGTADIFACAHETGTQVRYLGPSVRTIEDLFLRYAGVDAARRDA